MAMRSEKKFSSYTLALGVLLCAAGPAGSSDLDYPQLYRDLGLPEYADATITGLGRTNTSLADGISIKLQSNGSYGTLRTYYENALADLGWILKETEAVARMRKAGMLDQLPFNAVFCGPDTLAFQVTTTDRGPVRELSISVVQGSNSCSQ